MPPPLSPTMKIFYMWLYQKGYAIFQQKLHKSPIFDGLLYRYDMRLKPPCEIAYDMMPTTPIKRFKFDNQQSRLFRGGRCTAL